MAQPQQLLNDDDLWGAAPPAAPPATPAPSVSAPAPAAAPAAASGDARPWVQIVSDGKGGFVDKAGNVPGAFSPSPNDGPYAYRDAQGTLWRPDGTQGPNDVITSRPAPTATPMAAPATGAMSDADLWGDQTPAAPAPGPVPVTAEGLAKAGGSGVLTGLESMNPEAALGQGESWGMDAADWISKHLLAGNPDAADGLLANLQAARRATLPTGPEALQAAGLYHAPQNTAEDYASTIGSMAPGVVFGPEADAGLIPQLATRAANVVVPGVTSETAGQGAKALGAPDWLQDVARLAGGVAGGVGANLRWRGGAEAPVAPESIAPIADTKPGQRAVAYVASRAGTAPAAIESAQAAGKPVILAQRLGNGGEIALGSLARQPGATGDLLNAHALDPATGVLPNQPSRLLKDFTDATGIDPAAAAGDMDTLHENLKNGVAGPAYARARATPGPIWNDTLAGLAQRPIIKQAMGIAAGSLRNAGKDPASVGLSIDPDTGAPVTGTDLNQTTEMQPTAEAWMLTKRYLGGLVERDPFGRVVKSGKAGIFNDDIDTASRDLTGALRDAIPGYGEALDKAGDYLSLRKAFEDGQTHAATSGTSSRAVVKYVAGLTPAEKQAYAGGFANKLFELADNGKLNPGTYKTPAFQTKLQAAVGQGPAQKIITGAQQEKAIADSLGETLPRSGPSTAKFKQEMEGQNNVPGWVQGASEFAVDSAIPGIGPHVALAKQGMKLAPKIPQLVAKPFQMNEATRDAAGKLLMSPDVSPADLTDYAARLKASRRGLYLQSPSVLSIPQRKR